MRLILDYTRRCNSHCKSCGIWALKHPVTLEMEYIDKLLAQLRPEYVFVTGGEPYLTDDIVAVADLVARYSPGCQWEAATNCIDEGTERRIQAVSDRLPQRINLSLEGNAEQHDAARRTPGNYARVMAVRSYLREHGIPYIVSTVTLEGLAEGRRLGDETYYNIPRHGVRFGGTAGEDPSRAIPSCFGASEMCVCDPEGDMWACEVYQDALYLGSIKEMDVSEMRWNEVRKHVVSGACSPCSMSCWYPR